MPLDPIVKSILDQMAAMPRPPIEQMSPEDFRSQEFNVPRPTIPVANVYDRLLPLAGRTIPVRVYVPEMDTSTPQPALVFYHGGGWVTGSIESHDPVCRFLCNAAACVVISVEYRLAPEHKFPAAVWDAYDAAQWIAVHADEFAVDPARIAVGGDSAGGNLAAVTCLIAKERNSPDIAFQLLIYPSTGYAEAPPSIRENAEGYMLTGEMMTWFRNHYLNSSEELLHPYFAPVLAEDLGDLPPAFIATAEFDPLRDVGKMYADKLQSSGVPVAFKNYEGLIHGFANFADFVPLAKTALGECAIQLRQAMHG